MRSRYLQPIKPDQKASPPISPPISPPAVSDSVDHVVYTVPRAEIVETLNRALARQAPNAEADTNTPDQTTHDRNSDHPDTVSALSDLAYLCERQGRYPEAERLYQQVITFRRQRLGDEHLELAESLGELAALYQRQKRYSQAQKLLQQALTIKQRRLVSDHPQIADTLYQLANIFCHQRLHDKAEPLYQEALTIFRKHLGAQHPRTQAVYSDFMQMIATAIESGQFEDLIPELPPLDLDSLGKTYLWAKPSWERPRIDDLDVK